MRILWLLLAILLTCLTIGGILTAFDRSDGASIAGDLVISLLLGLGATACWRQARISRQPQASEGDSRPWHHE
ncbi:hypothetical protein ACWD3J_46495 [Streptomyces sp. NPDC002755]|uniref:hypothetical protein n=1 Tax=Streptomyces sp. NPDC002884 TaxID=3154544 RepID=UPI0033200B15